MQISVSIHEIISWIITTISISLFIYERKKNSLTPFYMNLQGLLKACHAKTVFYWHTAKDLEGRMKTEEIEYGYSYMNQIFLLGVSNDFEALKQTVMGIMKAIEPDKDMPFDDRDYTALKEQRNT